MSVNRKILIVGCDYFKEEIKRAGVNVAYPYRTGKIAKMVLLLYTKLKLPVRSLLFRRDWLKPFVRHDVIILFDCSSCGDENDMLRRIEHVVSDHTRLIYYRWNTVDTIKYPIALSDRWEHWTFDCADAQKYHIKYANSFYFEELALMVNECKYDVSFVGLNKGRKPLLKIIENKLHQIGYSTFFHIVEKRRLFKRNNRMSYQEVRHLAQISKSILEVQKPNQNGLSLRALEALFFGKKLITNNTSIREYSFYNQNNIFCFEDLNFNEFKSFMSVPYADIENSIKKQYTFDSWLNRILENKEAVL